MLVTSEYYDPNQNKYHKLDGNILTTPQSISSSATNINHTPNNSQLHSYHHQHHQQFQHMNERYNTGNANHNGTNNNNNNNNNNGHMNGLSSAVLHPALLNIMNEAQGMKFRG